MPRTLFIINFVHSHYLASILLFNQEEINNRIYHSTSIPPMQKSTISTQTNHVDIKKYSSNRKTDAVMTKHTAPFTLRFMTSSSESSFAVPVLDSYSIKDYIDTITHNYSNRSNKRAEMKISGVTGICRYSNLWTTLWFQYRY